MSGKTRLREFHEGACAVRQAEPEWRQAVLLLARHFAESRRVAIRQKTRIVAETLSAARRPDDVALDARFEFFQMAVGPCDTQCRHEMRSAAFRRQRTALAQHGVDAQHGG